MRPLTDITPKALLRVGGKPLIVWHIERLRAARLNEIVINLAHLGDQIEREIKDGAGLGVSISYSREREALETAGGIAFALPLLGDDPFVVVNADVYCEFDFSKLKPSEATAHLMLVDNPPYHPRGDFALTDGKLAIEGSHMLTFSGIGVYRPELFSGIRRGTKAALAPILREAMRENRVSGERYDGVWVDVGTPERLKQLDEMLSRSMNLSLPRESFENDE